MFPRDDTAVVTVTLQCDGGTAADMYVDVLNWMCAGSYERCREQ